jgi:membrane-associated protein
VFDVNSIIEAGGLLLIAAIIFAESGMFIGFFFPGDTLLLAAGVFAAQGKLSFLTVVLTVIIAAVCGDNLGYYIGKRYGRKLFKKRMAYYLDRNTSKKPKFFMKNMATKQC